MKIQCNTKLISPKKGTIISQFKNKYSTLKVLKDKHRILNVVVTAYNQDKPLTV